MIDILIKNAMVITVDARRRVFGDGAVAIQGQKILEVGPSAALEARYQAEKVIDASFKIAMPGMVNCHMHLPQVMMRGVNDSVEVMDKLKNYIWPIQGNYDEDDALISARLGVLEMIKAGTTAFISTGMHPRYGIDRIAQLMLDSGIRGALSKYVMDISGYALDKSALHPGVWETGEESVKMACELIEKWNGAGSGRLQVWFSPRSVGGVSPELFRKVNRLAAEYGVGITAHWAEVQNNVDYCVNTYGLRPAFFADSVGMLGKNVTFAHGIYFDDSEIDLLAKTGTNICHCPTTNSKLAMGVAKISKMFRAGVNVCLGNDGMPVNNTADMFREMRLALNLQRNTTGDPIFPSTAEGIEMATLNGARALQAEDRVGSLEAGKDADIILIDAFKPHMVPVHDPASVVAWAANGEDVETVIIQGRMVMENRRVLTLDEGQILKDAEARKEKILQQSGAAVNHTWPVL